MGLIMKLPESVRKYFNEVFPGLSGFSDLLILLLKIKVIINGSGLRTFVTEAKGWHNGA